DIDGNPTDLADCNNNGVHVSQIRLDEDSEGTISDCVFEHEHVGNNTELPASIFCEDSSPIVQSSTFKLLLPQNEREILVLLSCFLDVKFFSNKI
ncbi:hypothetical protein H8D57_00750, partial [bacterium]|nr:hypothetical protein [bacterium]